ncbi:MAG: Gfo/Idh/MocA family oxidoreductase [bacterium]|nr:Gfo/Idh/MocA family oxidoreductase [bacterium]
MKQILQSFKTGDLTVEDVPAPAIRPGFVVVGNTYSLISSGTEGGTVKLGKMNMLQKARARPEQVKKVLKVVRTDGVLAAYSAVSKTIEMPIPLGYCCAGRVIEVGEGVSDLNPGQAVACGGAGFANHAEVVSVPRNLVVEVPEGVSERHAAFTTLGSIAMQSLRVADVRLGENVVVIGLGLVGILTVQLLKAAGCRVFGIDVSQERLDFADEHVLCSGALRSADNLVEQVTAFSHGHGADSVIITAATPNSDPVSLAGELARLKGRVVVVGRTEMTAPRETFLFKELELRTSFAYGPGTGDPSYEEGGLDYPVGYVRWTENRNMQAFVNLIAAGDLDLESMISHEFPIAEAAQAFDLVTGRNRESSLAILLKYPPSETKPTRRIELGASRPTGGSELGVGVIGAGSHATNFVVPILAKTPGLALRGICSASGVRAQALGRQYRFNLCASDPQELLSDEGTNGVVILTRHDTHAPLTVAALEAGKHVFVEKPMAMSLDELRRIVATAQRTSLTVQVGFNRRFAPLAMRLKRFFTARSQPMAITFRANVGYRPPEHWLHDPAQGGGVILGEAVHFIDFCHWLTGSPPVEVATRAVNGESTGLINADNVHISLSFADGSIATVIYLSNGDPALSREQVEVYAEGGVAVLEDFKRLTLSRSGTKRTIRRLQDRGHKDQMRALCSAWQGSEPELPLASSALSVLATLKAVESMEAHKPLEIDLDEVST